MVEDSFNISVKAVLNPLVKGKGVKGNACNQVQAGVPVPYIDVQPLHVISSKRSV